MVDTSFLTALLQSSAGEWVMILSLIFGGCSSNVWALEGVLKDHPKSGTFLTFAQFAYVAIQNLSSQLELGYNKKYSIPYPKFKERQVPLTRWAVNVALFLAVSLMNNYAFGLKIPVTVHIIFRSGGLCVSMLVGWFVGKRRYSPGQILAGALITVGIILATLSAPHRRPTTVPSAQVIKQASTAKTSTPTWIPDEMEYLAGISLLAMALFLAAFLGLWQEKTYAVYGNQWKESLFYCHFLSLPFFLPMLPSLRTTYTSFASTTPMTLLSLPHPSLSSSPSTKDLGRGLGVIWHDLVLPSALFALALNLITQGLCIRGVNRLTTRVNAVTVNLVLTVRKAVSLAISVWYYGSGFTWGLAAGGAMVMFGTILYSLAPGPKGLPTTPAAAATKPKIRSSPRPIPVQLPNQSEKTQTDGLLVQPLSSAGLRQRQSPVASISTSGVAADKRDI